MSEPAPLPCLTCHARCCSYAVAITALDAIRLQRDLGRSAAEFTVLSERDPDRVGFLLRAGGPRFRIVLARQTAGDLEGWCTFFRADESAAGAGGCSVYSSRPMPCRMFPATLTYGRVELRVPVPCPDGAWGPKTALWGPSWQTGAERTVTEQLLDFAMNVAWNRTLESGVESGVGGGADTPQHPTPPAADYPAYLDWVGQIYLALDRHTGCLDPRGPIDPAAIAGVKALLRR